MYGNEQVTITCRHCNTPHKKVALEGAQHASCSQCKKLLYGNKKAVLHEALALSISATLFFAVSNLFPILTINILGASRSLTIVGSAMHLIDQGFLIVGIMVFFVIFLFPLMLLVLTITFLFAMLRKKRRIAHRLLLILTLLRRWDMLGIFFVSILVAVVKIVDYATIEPGVAFWSLLLFLALDLWFQKRFPTRHLWQLYHEIEDVSKESIAQCRVCDAPIGALGCKEGYCDRCHMPHPKDKELYFSKAFAYLVTAVIAYIPANIYPMLYSSKFGIDEGNTIIGGVIVLWQLGNYPIAAIVFVASILIPIAKFLILLYLLISVKYAKGKYNSKHKKRLFMLAELSGPWSMVDVFVVAILATLIRFWGVEVMPGIAATAFALCVWFTLLSAYALGDYLKYKECH